MSEKHRDVHALIHISGFSPEDEGHLHHLGQHLVPRLPELTERFYGRLLADDRTRPHVEGRVEQLKKTHIAWLTELFTGDYGEAFIAHQRRVGEAHVAAGIPPLFVAASMSFLRGALPEEIEIAAREIDDPIGVCVGAVLRLLDLCQYLIDSAYEVERMRRLMAATGMSLVLLEYLFSLRPQ